MTLTAPDRPDTDASDELDHLYCCDENVAMCGIDLTDVVEIPADEDGPVCPLCNYVESEGLPCPAPGCKQ